MIIRSLSDDVCLIHADAEGLLIRVCIGDLMETRIYEIDVRSRSRRSPIFSGARSERIRLTIDPIHRRRALGLPTSDTPRRRYVNLGSPCACDVTLGTQ